MLMLNGINGYDGYEGDVDGDYYDYGCLLFFLFLKTHLTLDHKG